MESLSRFLSPSTISRRFLNSSSVTFTAADGSVSSVSSPRGRVAPESVAYHRSMLRPPPAVNPRNLRRNACSFIGMVDGRVQRSGNSRGGPKAFTFLEVKSDPRRPISSTFRVTKYGESPESTPERVWLHRDGGRLCVEIRKQQGRFESFHLSGGEERSRPANFLDLSDKLAEISLKHLKPNDFIYVSGLLGSYEKLNASGQREIFYKVAVQDLNYVRQFDQRSPTLKNVTPGSEELFASPSGPVGEETPGASGPKPEEQHLDRLHLWHLFFASPNEWWDNRRHKKNTRLPDFKHKDTKECLWLTPDDPPWVRRQLELYDSNMKGALQRDASHWLDSHKWKLKDF